jgi:hypothetical protein
VAVLVLPQKLQSGFERSNAQLRFVLRSFTRLGHAEPLDERP